MNLIEKYSNYIFSSIIFLAFLPFVSPSLALFGGILLSLIGIKNESFTKHTSLVLKIAIVLLGFGMNLTEVISASESGFVFTAISVVFVLSAGFVLAKLFKVDGKTGMLISVGTAICGGSAIAAVSPVINAKNNQISFSLIVIFVLNGIALIIFPVIGHYFNLSQEVFGNWAAIAIHDTSSVVGAGAAYGKKALEIATTVKLIRALWIIPLSLVIAFFSKGNAKGKVKLPWFIGLFVISILITYFFPQGAEIYYGLSFLGKRIMVISLFLIGSSISIDDMKKAGVKSFAMGILLWIIIGVGSFVSLTGVL